VGVKLPRWVRDFARRPGDTERESFQKALILLIALTCCACGVLWGLMYATVFGWGPTAALPLAFCVIVGGTAVVSARIADHRPLIYAQIGCIVWISALIEWTIGSASGSGVVIVWSFLGPIGALIFLTFRQALVWMGMFLAIVLVSTGFQPALLGAPLAVPARVQSAFFAMNVGTASLVVFAAAAWFVKTIQRELTLRLETNEALAESHRQLAESQQALVQSEKMAALGRLSAGMAHELNNPASAAVRGSSQLRETVARLSDVSLALGQGHHAAELHDQLDQLAALAEQRAREPLNLSAPDRLDRETEIEVALEDRGLPALVAHATDFVDLGIDKTRLDRLCSDFGDAAIVPALERAVLWHAVVSLIAGIEHSADRVSKIVGALRSYTFLDQGAVQTVNLNAGLSDTLLMMNSVLEHGFVLRRDLDPALPPITAQGSNLNQVWTNLIANAADAMRGEGEIIVRTRREEEHAVIQIIDSGPGIPVEVEDRIFDPFVTTKPVGEGTGLGLYVSRNIVAQHGGTLSVDSRPGRTCFEVRLPLTRQGTGTVDPRAGSEAPLVNGEGAAVPSR
jgi:signal transduction histidine kinase